ncbi:hypothetical protein VNI00_013156 [Paramarasmius palmivorus]|uniref:Uncharacterized protein n=1 Tax=Paramarasmius palmivorus TaxID=297713 RepID=A0AAW0C0E6_9AGAR
MSLSIAAKLLLSDDHAECTPFQVKPDTAFCLQYLDLSIRNVILEHDMLYNDEGIDEADFLGQVCYVSGFDMFKLPNSYVRGTIALIVPRGVQDEETRENVKKIFHNQVTAAEMLIESHQPGGVC